MGWQWGQARYQVIGYLIPLGYSTFTYSIAWLTGIAALKPDPDCRCLFTVLRSRSLVQTSRHRLYFLVVATIGVIQNCATTLGEEIRWRGFLVPELAKRFSFTATAVLSGVIWALWHVPIILFAGYNMGTGWFGLAVVSANMIGLCFVLTWLRLKSGSIWPGVILHASSNHLIQQFFDSMTVYTKQLMEQGEKSVVLEYFSECRAFWKMGAAKLDSWAASVQRGEVPKFGPNLLY
jgi:membrane protease YdiL (CAAX protease family)